MEFRLQAECSISARFRLKAELHADCQLAERPALDPRPLRFISYSKVLDINQELLYFLQGSRGLECASIVLLGFPFFHSGPDKTRRPLLLTHRNLSVENASRQSKVRS